MDTDQSEAMIIDLPKRFQHASDLHIEHHYNSCFKDWESILYPVAPYLILNGDIVAASSSKQAYEFLRWCKLNWTEVFYVPGNHEYYNVSIDEGDDILEKICYNLGVHYLNRRSVFIDDVLVIGCTLWSHIPTCDSETVGQMINDFHLIKGNTVEKHNRRHELDMAFIIRELTNAPKDMKCIVATHHCPNQDLARLKGSTYDLSSAFGTDIIGQFKQFAPKIQVWLYGHSHINASKHFNGIRVTCNQLGYNPRSFKSMKYHPDSTF